MRHAKELEHLDKAIDRMCQVRYWLERMAEYNDEPIPETLNAIENDLASARDRIVERCESVKRAFENEYGLFSGTHIQVWNPNRPKYQTVQRVYIRPPGALCDAPHMTKFEWETIGRIMGCDDFAYEEPYDIYVMNGKSVFKILKGNGNGRTNS